MARQTDSDNRLAKNYHRQKLSSLRRIHTDGDAAQINRFNVLAQQAALETKHIPAHYLVTARHRPDILFTSLKIVPWHVTHQPLNWHTCATFTAKFYGN